MKSIVWAGGEGGGGPYPPAIGRSLSRYLLLSFVGSGGDFRYLKEAEASAIQLSVN